MSDPSAAMQKAVVARLKAVSGVTNLVAQRIHDRAPENVVYPFVQIGYFQSVDDSADCVDCCEVSIEIHVWSEAVGQVEAKAIASAVRAALHRHVPTLDDPFAPVGEIEHRDTRLMGGGDGVRTHAVATFRAIVETV